MIVVLGIKLDLDNRILINILYTNEQRYRYINGDMRTEKISYAYV